MRKTEKGDNSVMDFENFTKNKSGHLHLRHSLFFKYHDSSSSGSEDIFFTSFQWVIIRITEREVIQSWSKRILPNVNQVNYTLDTIYNLNTMALAQAVFEIFCSQAYIGL